MSEKNFSLWFKILVSFWAIGLLAANILPTFLSSPNKSRNARAKENVGVVINRQFENYYKMERFISPDEFRFIEEDSSNRHEYQMSFKGDDIFIVTAAAKDDGLYSFTGIVFVSRGVGTYGVSKGVCVTTLPARTPPQVDLKKHSYSSSDMCPVGSELLKR